MQPTEPDDVAEVLDAAATATPATAPPVPPSEDADDFLEQLAALEASAEEKESEDIAQIMDTELAETTGRWFHWPALKGAEIQIAHFSAAIDRKSELETKYRKSKSKLPNDPLPPKVDERLWEEALFGTVVRSWRGMRYNGYELPFNQVNYRMVMRLRRFRSFVLGKAREAQNFRDAARETVAGN